MIYVTYLCCALKLSDKNIICTNRAMWRVKSTINDECVRNKMINILLDLLCNDFIEHAFFLFQYLLKDQSNRYHPIGKVGSIGDILAKYII